MKSADPAAYTDIVEINAASAVALGKQFRGLMLICTSAGSITFTITQPTGVSTASVVFALLGNTTTIFPISGGNIVWSAGGGANFKAYALR